MTPDDPAYRLYEDGFGVRHWCYPFTGVLLLCGKEQFFKGGGQHVAGTSFPTCLTCIHVLMREEAR